MEPGPALIPSLPGRADAAGRVAPDERWLAGLVAGGLCFLGGLSLVALTVVPGIGPRQPVVLLGLATIACAGGVAALVVVDWDRVPSWTIHAAAAAALPALGLEIACSGGADSPASIDLFFLAVFAGYFFRARAALLYLLGCALIHASPLLYDRAASREAYLTKLTLATLAYLVLGGIIWAGQRRMALLRGRAEGLAREQAALRRVATAVVGGESADSIYERVAFEAARLLGSGAAGILRLGEDASAVVVGAWADRQEGRYEPGRTVEIEPGSDLAAVLRLGRPVRIGCHPPGSPVHLRGYRSSIVAPVRVAGRIWGMLAVTAAEADHFSARHEDHLVDFGDLLATAIVSLEDRAKLAAQALTDPLTGLANHRALQQRLRAEVARAVRHGTPLSVAVLDIDNFKQINDSGGHDAGDEMLVQVANCLGRLARAEDTVGRLGGDEFAWVLPETGREQALVAVERARRMIAALLRRPYKVTVSAGICDTTMTQEASQLVNLADDALYWSKAHGRNQAWLYDPRVDTELSARERAERLRRSEALAGLRALARAIDAKDPATSRHSERVADLVRRLAVTVGWSEHRAQLLSEAALVHDVGKIGIPDSLLRKSGPLTDPERELVKSHAELAARIVEDVLTAEQVAWIRTHHERPDGFGYPRGLRAHEIPEGAALLAAADAWDVMTSSRSYSLPKSDEEAMVECIDLVGRQFTKPAVSALARLHASGELVGRPAAADLACV